MAKLSYLDLSTGHLPLHDRRLLAQECQATFVHYYEYGWYMPVYDGVLDAIDRHNAENDGDDKHTPAFRRLYEYAIEQGASLIRLDMDGDEDENLEYFED